MSEASNAAPPVSLTLALNLDTGQRVRRSRWLNARKAAAVLPGLGHRLHPQGNPRRPPGAAPQGEANRDPAAEVRQSPHCLRAEGLIQLLSEHVRVQVPGTDPD